MPLIIGSTTPKLVATATVASKAFPPSARMLRPACVAKGLAELTIPDAPLAGLVDVLWLGFGAGSATGAEVVGSVVSSPAIPSSEEVVSSPASSRGALFSKAVDGAQELSIATTNPTKNAKSILLKIRSQKDTLAEPTYNTGQEKQPLSSPMQRVGAHKTATPGHKQ